MNGGRFSVADEAPHPTGEDPQHNESMYFNVAGGGYGGLFRIGNRVNEGISEVTALVYLPDGGALFHYAREPYVGPGFAAGGLAVEMSEPGRRLQLHYGGPAHHLARGTDLGEPGATLRSSPQRDLVLDLDYVSLAAPFGLGDSEVGTEGMGGGEEVVARHHYELPCRVTGRLSIDGVGTDLAGFGVRDHSWGARRWQGPTYWRWLSAMFDEHTGFVAWLVKVGDDRGPGSGMLLRNGRTERLVGVRVRTDYGPPPHYPRAASLQLTAEGGDVLDVAVRVVSAVPLRNRRDGVTARLAELLCEYRLADGAGSERVGHGIAEFHDLILDGVPAGIGEV